MSSSAAAVVLDFFGDRAGSAAAAWRFTAGSKEIQGVHVYPTLEIITIILKQIK